MCTEPNLLILFLGEVWPSRGASGLWLTRMEDASAKESVHLRHVHLLLNIRQRGREREGVS